MSEELVMRSVYLAPSQDSKLRQLAHDYNVTKSDLIRTAISLKLEEWLKGDAEELIIRDIQAAEQANAGANRSARDRRAARKALAQEAAPAAAPSAAGVSGRAAAAKARSVSNPSRAPEPARAEPAMAEPATAEPEMA